MKVQYLIFLSVFIFLQNPLTGFGQNYRLIHTPIKNQIITGELDTVEKFVISVFYTTDGVQLKYFHDPYYAPISVKQITFPPARDLEFLVQARATKPGIYKDSIEFDVWAHELRSTGQINQYSYKIKAFFQAIIRDDSVIRIRPTFQTFILEADTVHSGWAGMAQIWLDNNTHDTATFSDWLFTQFDSSYTTDLTLTKGLIKVDTLLVPPLTRFDTLLVSARSKRGPIYSIFDTLVSLTAHVFNGKDSLHNITLRLRYLPAPYKRPLDTNKVAFSFVNDAGSTEFQETRIKLFRPITITSIPSSHPFSFQVMNEDSVVWLRVTCNPESAGFYKDKRSIYYVTKDFNGDPRTDSIVVTVTSNAKTTTPKKYWESTTFIEANIDEIATEKKGPVFVLTDKGRSLFRSYDGMRDWQQLSFPSMYIHSITRESGVLFCIDSANRLLRSSDDGTTWENIGDSLYFFVYCNQSAKAFGSPRVILSDHKGGVYVLITARWGCYAEDNYNQSIHFSKDSGRTWKSILNYSHSGRITDPVDSAFFAHSFYLTQSGDPVLIGSRYKLVLMDSLGVLNIVDTVGKVFTSNDTGKSIQNTTLLFDDAKGIISPFNSTIFLIAQRDGIYSTTDHGKNWYGINDDINTKYFTTIFCAPGMPIYLGTAASGLWRSIITTPELATKISKPTFKDALHCYPNPATSSVTIVTGDSPVRDIQLFNQLGREVPGFKSKVIEEGFTSQTIDVRNLPVGCYYFVVSYKNDNKSYVKLLIGM